MPNFKKDKSKFNMPGMMFKHKPAHKGDEGPVEKRIYVDNSNKVGSYVSEDELESKFSLKGGNPRDYPQLSVQDYSTVKQDTKGKYVVKTGDE